MPNAPHRSVESDALAATLYADLNSHGMPDYENSEVGIRILSEYLQKVRDQAMQDAIEACRDAGKSLDGSALAKDTVYGWNNAVSECVLSLQRLSGSPAWAPPSAGTPCVRVGGDAVALAPSSEAALRVRTVSRWDAVEFINKRALVCGESCNSTHIAGVVNQIRGVIWLMTGTDPGFHSLRTFSDAMRAMDVPIVEVGDGEAKMVFYGDDAQQLADEYKAKVAKGEPPQEDDDE